MVGKKIWIQLLLPLVAVSFLASCGGSGSAPSTQNEEVNVNSEMSSAAQLRRAATAITNDLADSFPRDEGLRVAVMPFTDMDGVTVNYLGFYLSEKVTNELVVAAPALDVLERSRIEEVLGELELGMSGLLDDASVQEAGRALGADAIVVGSMAVIGRRDIPGSEIEANVRVISVGRMKAVASTSYSLVPDAAIWDMMDRRMSGKVTRKSTVVDGTSYGGTFVDDFNPSTGNYRFSNVPDAVNPMGKYFFNDSAGRLEIRNGDNVGLWFSGNLPSPTTTGRVSVTFFPTKVYPYSGHISIGLLSGGGDGYAFMFPKSYYKASIHYQLQGKHQLIWDRKGDSFDLNRKHTIALEFSPEKIVGLFDGVKIFSVRNEHEFMIETFAISTAQMDCFIESLEIK